ncbi:hypothetical protein Slala04_62290 [Streptomyces lavendulae subsp. lavendulae]|nr:hypothetical protein Slala04_62290 [Streptomyces lavendulae subsp. lavendulae]
MLPGTDNAPARPRRATCADAARSDMWPDSCRPAAKGYRPPVTDGNRTVRPTQGYRHDRPELAAGKPCVG